MNQLYMDFLEEMRGRNVAVLGMGVSNTPLIWLLLKAGAHVTICDRNEHADGSEFAAQGAVLQLGEAYLAGLECEFIFRTPGMRPDLPEIRQAVAEGAVLTSEMEAFFRVCPCPIIGVTGSDGKTTTTTIIYELLRAQGYKCYVGGNIGTPLLDRASEMTPEDKVVVELSSFQLMTMRVSPQIAVVTNLAPNHLDLHTSMEEYIDAKRNIYCHQAPDGRVVLNWDNKITRTLGTEVEHPVFFSRKDPQPAGVDLQDGVICRAGHPVLPISAITIPGMHNVENYMAAIAAVGDWVQDETVRDVAKTFGGVPHRMELVRELAGVRYYNDSIASSPSRTMAGLAAFPHRVMLIAGGKDKGVPFDVLGPAVVEHCTALVLNGPTMEKIREAVIRAPGYDAESLPVYCCASFEEAVKTAHRIAKPGDIVTLSPACTSFDRFRNFAERGDYFKQLIWEL